VILPRFLIALVMLVAGLTVGRPGAAHRRASAARAAGLSHRAAAVTPTSSRLTVAQLAGQRVVYAYAGLRPPASLLRLIQAGEAGGVIFFSDNIASRRQIRGVILQLQKASLASPLHDRLLMLTDQEGGQVRRLPGAPALSEKQIGQQRNAVAAARTSGTGAGRNLAGVGITVNLAPVLDVFRRPGNFIDEYSRSYSSNSGKVGRLGVTFISSQQRKGVAASAKHFPGLGAADRAQNTDERPVTLRLSLSALRNIDEAPYRSAIHSGVKLVMTSWAVYPALDRRRPAGLSSRIIGTELRRRLGFRGVIITDAIQAGALRSFGGLGHRGVLAASAGADLILCSAATEPNSPALGSSVRQALVGALRKHQLGLSAARYSVTRILALRAHP
jgi:beta-N-acetylhexosaminidase